MSRRRRKPAAAAPGTPRTPAIIHQHTEHHLTYHGPLPPPEMAEVVRRPGTVAPNARTMPGTRVLAS